MKIDVIALPDCRHDWLAQEWQTLETASGATFFSSWTWIDAWLAAVTDVSALSLLRATEAGETVGLGIFGHVPRARGAFWIPRTLLLHETGRADEDAVTIEHNGLLVSTGNAVSAWNGVFADLSRRAGQWHRLRISGVADGTQAEALAAASRAHGFALLRRYSRPCYWVDLEQVRRSGASYLGALSSNTRYQIRRAFKAYGGESALAVSIADNLAEARSVLAALKELHTSYWRSRGVPGAFASEFAARFHDGLLERGVEQGRVQLVTISAGGEPIGYLYNFVASGRVLAYQSGFRYADDNKQKPGLVSHALAIQHSIDNAADTYDFLMGDNQYKRSLATDRAQMHWMEVRRPLLRFQVEDALRAAKSRLVQLRAAAAPSARP